MGDVINISTGTRQNPYREFSYTIAPGQTLQLDYASNNFALMFCSLPGKLTVSFGNQGGFTVMEQGMSFHSNEAFPYIRLKNTADEPLSLVMACGIGQVRDNRLSVSGVVQVANTNETALKVTDPAINYTVQTLTFDNRVGLSDICVLSCAAGKYTIQNPSQFAYVHIFSADGLFLLPYGSISLNSAVDFEVYGMRDQKVVILRED